MSAGTGVVHSEKNASRDKPIKFLQIWIFPNKKDVTPRYDQKKISVTETKNQLQTIVSPIGESDGVQIHQDAWFSIGDLDAGIEVNYNLHKEENGVYAFVLEGDVLINDIAMNRCDG
jgi:redox-sensitive bicupin YhaK (pirin superfamily)